jgi:hypothetical protein
LRFSGAAAGFFHVDWRDVLAHAASVSAALKARTAFVGVLPNMAAPLAR